MQINYGFPCNSSEVEFGYGVLCILGKLIRKYCVTFWWVTKEERGFEILGTKSVKVGDGGLKIPNFSAMSFLNAPLNNMKFGPGAKINEKIARSKKFSHEVIIPKFYFIINFPNETETLKPSAHVILVTCSTT